MGKAAKQGSNIKLHQKLLLLFNIGKHGQGHKTRLKCQTALKIIITVVIFNKKQL